MHAVPTVFSRLVVTREFAVTFDYRCPFARNAHEHVVAALEAGADWSVEMVPFSLTQSHVEEGETPVWEDPSKEDTLLAAEASIAVRSLAPEHFLEVHLGLFRARHDQGRDLRSAAAVRDVLESCGVDADTVFEAISDSWPRKTFRAAHEEAQARHAVFGVPTFISDGQAVFVRIMTRPDGDAGTSRALIERVLSISVEHPELNEIKHTTISN